MALDLKCNNCSSRMPAQARFCPNCGTPAPELEQGAGPPPVATAEAGDGAPANGNAASARVAFDSEPLTETQTPAAQDPSVRPESPVEPLSPETGERCPACGYPTRSGASFCEKCSHKMWRPDSGSVGSKSIDYGADFASGSLAAREAALRQAVSERATVRVERSSFRPVAICPRCETRNLFGAPSCTGCGLPLEHFSPEGVPYEVAKLGNPAGFWVRFLAFLADVAIVFGIGAALWPVLFGETFWIVDRTVTANGSSIFWRTQSWHVLIWLLYSIVFHALYGATPGKRIFKLKVYDDRHRRGIGFGSATVRVVTMWLSALSLLTGFIMAGVRKDKRALHDLIAGTYPTSFW